MKVPKALGVVVLLGITFLGGWFSASRLALAAVKTEACYGVPNFKSDIEFLDYAEVLMKELGDSEVFHARRFAALTATYLGSAYSGNSDEFNRLTRAYGEQKLKELESEQKSSSKSIEEEFPL